MSSPRNLAPVIADALRKLGFEVWEQAAASSSISLVTGWWRGRGGEQFIFHYAHSHPPDPAAIWWGSCSLGYQAGLTTPVSDYFTTTQVRRLCEVHLLLLGNEQFAQARAAIPSPSVPTPSPQL